ncbi:MAG: ABC transporter permease subunit [Treponema sp.]|nr:ABC transporter permease subunit [Treponema sp.]
MKNNQTAGSISKKPKLQLRDFRKSWDLYLMMLLPILWYVIFIYAPMYGIQIAFRDYMPSKGFLGSTFVGLKHFRRFFNSYYFVRVLKNTLGINFYSLLVGFPIPIIFALLLNELKSVRYKKLVQNITYLPHFLSTVVIVSIINMILAVDYGVVNTVLKALGREQYNFMIVPAFFKHIFVWSGIWENMGWDAIIYIAALAGVDLSLYEAATIDGASRWQKIRYISVPCIMPTIIIMLLLRTGHIMNIGYEKVLLMQNSLNMESSDVISTFVYRSGILGAEYSFASAVGFFNSVCNFFLLLVANRTARKLSETSLW